MFVQELKQEEQIDFNKHVEMISLELFITGELASNDETSILRAIGLLQSLLVRKHSNMKALGKYFWAIMKFPELKKTQIVSQFLVAIKK